ncbi:MAG: hypothetical protein WCA49_02975 [Candidatus Sulfotelmatobacter sp.]
MPTNLHRYYGAGYLHFITTSCYQRRALLGTPQSRDLFLEVMERVRRRYRFVVVGYVVMPEHEAALHAAQSRCPGLVLTPEQWNWSSLPSLRFGRAGISAGQRSTESGDAGARNCIV